MSCKSGYLPSGVDSRLIVVPNLVYNRALQEGFNVCEHHKCFILPMHRLSCWKERLLYSVPALVCAISLMSFCVYLIAAVSSSIPILHWEGGDAEPLYWLLQEEWMNLSDCVCLYLWECECHTLCFLYAECFCFLFFFLAFTNYWGQEFGEVALMEIP